MCKLYCDFCPQKNGFNLVVFSEVTCLWFSSQLEMLVVVLCASRRLTGTKGKSPVGDFLVKHISSAFYFYILTLYHYFPNI